MGKVEVMGYFEEGLCVIGEFFMVLVSFKFLLKVCVGLRGVVYKRFLIFFRIKELRFFI